MTLSESTRNVLESSVNSHLLLWFEQICCVNMHLIGRNILLCHRMSAAIEDSLLASPKWWHNRMLRRLDFQKPDLLATFQESIKPIKTFWFSALHLVVEQSVHKNDLWSHSWLTKCFRTSHLRCSSQNPRRQTASLLFSSYFPVQQTERQGDKEFELELWHLLHPETGTLKL